METTGKENKSELVQSFVQKEFQENKKADPAEIIKTEISFKQVDNEIN